MDLLQLLKLLAKILFIIFFIAFTIIISNITLFNYLSKVV